MPAIHDPTLRRLLGSEDVAGDDVLQRIRQILPAEFEKPRTVDLQTTAEFNEIVRKLRHDIDEEE